jgi:hypothetical protein
LEISVRGLDDCHEDRVMAPRPPHWHWRGCSTLPESHSLAKHLSLLNVLHIRKLHEFAHSQFLTQDKGRKRTLSNLSETTERSFNHGFFRLVRCDGTSPAKGRVLQHDRLSCQYLRPRSLARTELHVDTSHHAFYFALRG